MGKSVTSREQGVLHSGTHTAARYFLSHLEDAQTVIGYRLPREPKIEQLLEEDGVVGHSLRLKAPKLGFSEFQKDRFESYGRSLGIWKRMVVEFEWLDDEVLVLFRDAESDEAGEPGETAGGLRERMRSRVDKAARRMSSALVAQGFMVREPSEATMVTLKDEFHGTVLVFKYPTSREHDKAGITDAYDKWVPMLADVYSRETKTLADTMADGELTKVFFTRNKSFLPSLYEVTPSFKMIVPKQTKTRNLLLAPTSYSACRALAKQYRQHFDILRRPYKAWGVEGHSLILQYKKGAGGKVVDDSYFRNVSLFSEKLMKKYGLQCFIQHEPTARAIVVTFHTGAKDMHTGFERRVA